MDKTRILTALAAFLSLDSIPAGVTVEAEGAGYRVRGLPRAEATRFRLPVEVRRKGAPADDGGPTPGGDSGGPMAGTLAPGAAAFRARAEKAAEGTSTKTIGTVQGIASSTSRDFYGTDISRDGLEDMAAQFRASPGVPLLPTHYKGWSLPEWDDVIGVSVDAEVRTSEVADPVNNERGYVLDVASALYDVPKARELRDRLDIEQPIGQSIGGWFVELSFTYNEDTGELERVQVHKVELDHLAITRMPANPDAVGLVNLRSRLGACLRHRPATGAPDTRTAPGPASEPPAPAPVAAPAGNPPSVTARNIPADPLDTPSGSSEDGTKQAAARTSSPSPSPEEPVMNAEEIAQIVSRSVEEAVKGALPDAIRSAVSGAVAEHVAPVSAKLDALAARVSAVESRATPAAAPVATLAADGKVDTSEVAQLRAKLAEQDRLIVRLAESPDRRAIRSSGGPVPVFSAGAGAEAAFRSLATQAKTDGVGVALSAVVEKHAKIVAEEDGPASLRAEGSIRNLRSMLCAALRAAEADGLIAKPVTGWA